MKTFEELKDIIEDCIDWDEVMYETGSAKYNEAWKELEEAYEKQIAKPHIAGRCPECGTNIIGYQNIPLKYCSECGQKLNWSIDNDS